MEEDQITAVTIQGNEMAMMREKASIDIQVSTAKAYPRDMQKALSNSIFTATMDVETASTCTYSVPRGGKAITGPSVHLAKILMQNWGNIRGETKVIEIGAKDITSQSVVWDLENNAALKVEVKRSIMTRSGRMSDDMITVTGNAANAIALRNAIFGVIPRAIVDKVYNAAQQKIIGDAESFTRRLKAVLAGFKKTYSKEEAEVLSIVGKTQIIQITPDDLVVLIGTAQALKDGDTTVDVVFKPAPKTAEEKKAELKEKQAGDAAGAPGQQGSIVMP
jgi:hypothetical protein